MTPTIRFRATVLAVAVAAAAAAAVTLTGGSREPTAAEHMQAARAFLAAKERKAAIIELKNALAQQPGDAEARFLLGSAYLDGAEHASAEIELRRAVEFGHDRVVVLAALGRALGGQQKHQKALDELQAYGSGHGGVLPPALLTTQAAAQLALGAPQAATATLQAALRQAPDHAPAHLGLARIAAATADAGAALRHVEAALAHRPDDIEAWMFKGDVLRAGPSAEAAAAAYRQALALAPKDARPRLRLTDLHVAGGRFDDARAEIARVRAIEPDHIEALYQLAAVAVNQRRYAEADEVIQQVLKRLPDHPRSVLVAATAAHHLGKTETADRHLSAYLKHDPDSAYARTLFAANLLQGRQPALALEAIAPLAGPQGGATAVAIAGTAALESRQFAKAVGHLERAVALAPGDGGLRTKLAAARLGLGQDERGLADLEAAAGLDGKSSRPDVMLITTLVARRDFDRALAAVATMEKKLPQDPAVHNLRGLALRGKGDAAGARASFEKALALQPDYFPAADNLAAEDLGAGRRDAARDRYVRLLDANPRHVLAMVALADAAGVAGDDRARVEWLEKAVKADPQALQPRALLARHHADRGDFPRALAIAREAGFADPRDERAMNLLGTVQVAMGDREAAMSTYTAIVRAHPRSATAHYRLALRQADGGDLPAARASLLKALELQPRHTAAQSALAKLELRAGRPDEALKVAARLREQQPGSPAGAILEGDAALARRDAASAARAYAAAFEKAATPEILVRLHGALLQAGQAKEAERQVAQWLAKAPAESAGRARMYLAEAAIAAGRTAQAIAYYEAVLQSRPADATVLNNLAWLYQQQGDARALATAERAHQARPGDAAIADTLGWILLQQGDVARGLPVLERAAAKAPGSPALQYHLAAGYVKAGDRTRARSTLDALLASKAAFPERAEAQALRAQL